jgi:hypothetical protein
MWTARLPRARFITTSRPFPGWVAWPAAVLVGLFGGLAAVMVSPVFLIAGLAGMGLFLAVPLKGYKVFWGYLLFLLVGYFALGKGFAYIGFAPLYVAEIGLALALFAASTILLLDRSLTIAPFFRLEVLLLFAFIAWQVLCTMPYLDMYGLDVIRDAALWGYAAFALFILLLVPREAVDRLFIIYGKILPYYLAWLLVAWYFSKISPIGFHVPTSPTPLIHLKSGDAGVHLAGAAAFMLLRLDLRGARWSNAKLWFLWALWLVNWLAWGASNRAGMFSALIGIGVVLLWRPSARWHRPVVIALSMFALLMATNFSGPIFGTSNTISTEQVTANVTSTFGDSHGVLEKTKAWRLNWWEKIIGYTLNGEHFWMGKGYGINLSVDDGATVGPESDSLRSPHNVFMTVLARSGVPGLILWLLFLASFGSTLARKAVASKRTDSWDKRYALWLLAYWLAFLFNGSFDVFLEGPMGGVWFWSLVGISLVYLTKGVQHPRVELPRKRTLEGRGSQ